MATTPTYPPGKPTTLGRYSDRAIVRQRVDGVVQLRDEPADGEGRSYLIEPEVDELSELQGIVDDYKAVAERIEDVPMKRCWF